MNHEMEVEANRSGRKPGSERRDASASVGRAGNAACVLAHRIEDLRVLRIDVDSSAVPSLKSGPHRACAIGLDGSVVLRTADSDFRIGCSQSAVIKLHIGDSAADLREVHT